MGSFIFESGDKMKHDANTHQAMISSLQELMSKILSSEVDDSDKYLEEIDSVVSHSGLDGFQQKVFKNLLRQMLMIKFTTHEDEAHVRELFKNGKYEIEATMLQSMRLDAVSKLGVNQLHLKMITTQSDLYLRFLESEIYGG